MKHKKGFFRAWLAFTIIWAAVFGYLSWGSYSCQIGFHEIGVSENAAYQKDVREIESAPVFHSGGLNKKYYRAWANEFHHDKNSAEFFQTSEECQERLKAQLVLLFSIPMILLGGFFIVLWVVRGFKN